MWYETGGVAIYGKAKGAAQTEAGKKGMDQYLLRVEHNDEGLRNARTEQLKNMFQECDFVEVGRSRSGTG